MENRICHISTAHDVFDDRIFYKECKTLAEAGYEVYLIITHNKEETIDGVHIIPIPDKKGRFYRFLVKDWLALVRATKVNAKVYHFHDPELIFAGVMFKILGKKVIYDVHEDVSKQILNKEWLKPYFIRKAIAVLFGLVECVFSSFFDGIVTATEDIAKNFRKRKTITIRNLPILSLIDKAKPIKKSNSEKIIIIYAGGLTRIRGIRELVESVGIIGGEAELWLLGPWESVKFEHECRESYGWKYTKYLGVKKMNEVYEYMKSSDIGLVNFMPVPNHITSMPNKVFEYMACGIPIVMSDFPYWKKLFKEYALFANPKDPRDISEKIKIFMNNEELRAKMGKAGMLAVRNVYSWEVESRRLINLYSSILKQKAR